MRKILSLIIIAALLLVIFNLAQGSYESFFKLSEVTNNQGDLKSLQLKNNDLKKKLSNSQTDFYLEKEARDKLGYGRAGETIIVVKDSELADNKSPKGQTEVSNIEKWLELLKINF